ncbi:signal peptide peptidase SppA [Thalassotalea sp. PLHSN55]|uniref:signal peptide peptidase SppA n=1 Tax=Thalassotalea sp. PLHSN55 TaxID=3435888 RepID=UPI003F833095
MIKKILSKTWTVLNTFRKVIINLVFFTLLFVFFAALTSSDNEIIVPKNSALVLNIRGDIVEQKKEIEPVNEFLNQAMQSNDEDPEVLIGDIIKVIEHAKTDDRIELLVLQLHKMKGSGITKLKDISQAIESFKESGKKVIAIGDQYSQNQYYLASYADEIWLNPKGWLMLDGYGRYQLYFKSALEKLSISQHVFRVGTYKSAVEPYIRDDMSDAAKEANKVWLNDLWSQYKEDVATQRNFEISNFDETTDALVSKLKAADGNIATYALNNQWVDQLKNREQINQSLVEMVGKNKHNAFKHIKFNDYLTAITPAIPMPSVIPDKVAVIVAQGTILDGTQKAGTIGGDSTAKLLRKARLNDDVKAVVLRVDSPGGSAHASEIIRQEVELLKAAGKPVVASMGTYAASGGYWISAPANKIYASPTTITGSIGIFGFMITLENSLSKLGIHTDGVGTTEIAGFGLTRPLTDGMADIFQLSIERGYRDFISLVAESRDMSLAQVDAIAQGRVWSGVKAKELGLVDELGNLDDAIAAAASIAGLAQFDTLLIEKTLSARDQFLKELLGQASVYLGEPTPATITPVNNVFKTLQAEFEQFNNMNDPQGIYSFCLTCQVN